MSDYFNWDGTIEVESGEFILLPEGEYDFRVTQLDKTTSNKTSAPMAVVHLRIEHDGGETTLKDYLVLSRQAEWKLCSFFRAIGLKKSGEPFVMNWNLVEGRSGRAKIKQEKYSKKDGGEGISNKVDSYLDCKDDPIPF